jgi:hypothetical protein
MSAACDAVSVHHSNKNAPTMICLCPITRHAKQTSFPAQVPFSKARNRGSAPGAAYSSLAWQAAVHCGWGSSNAGALSTLAGRFMGMGLGLCYPAACLGDRLPTGGTDASPGGTCACKRNSHQRGQPTSLTKLC